MKEIVSVGFRMPTDENDYISIGSHASLSDADIVLLRADLYSVTFSGMGTNYYRGKVSYDLNTSSTIKEHGAHWRKELTGYLKSGRNLYLFLNKKETFYVHSGQTRTSGTGRNQKVTNLVDEYDNYQYCPFSLKISNATGKKMKSNSQIFKPFLDAFKDELKFEAHIEDLESEEVITTKSGDKVLGGVFGHLNGKVIVLPDITDFGSKYYNVHDEWSAHGLKQGKKLIQAIVQIENSFKNTETKTPTPGWVQEKEYNLAKAEKTKSDILKANQDLEKLTDKILELEEVVKSQEVLKDLLFETGSSLENSVIRALEILDYTAENYDDGVLELDQVITSPEGQRFIGECEGKDKKSIDIQKLRQLMDSLNEDFARDEVEDKAYGILFGNPHRLLPLEERGEPFTKKCLNGAEREKIALVQSIDLFTVARYLSEHKNAAFKKKCRAAIEKAKGGIVTFPKVPAH